MLVWRSVLTVILSLILFFFFCILRGLGAADIPANNKYTAWNDTVTASRKIDGVVARTISTSTVQELPILKNAWHISSKEHATKHQDDDSAILSTAETATAAETEATQAAAAQMHSEDTEKHAIQPREDNPHTQKTMVMKQENETERENEKENAEGETAAEKENEIGEGHKVMDKAEDQVCTSDEHMAIAAYHHKGPRTLQLQKTHKVETHKMTRYEMLPNAMMSNHLQHAMLQNTPIHTQSHAPLHTNDLDERRVHEKSTTDAMMLPEQSHHMQDKLIAILAPDESSSKKM